MTKVTLPAALAGKSSGELSAELLLSTPGLGGGPTVRLVEPAARSWRAMAAAALADGITLRATSSADSYRTLAQQIQTFKSRYTREFLAGRPFRRWQGHKWFQRPNTAVAAVPGTSNHGLGLAVDVAGAT
ncbi:MAG: D-alanyl-D-alanine carboxypeptidase family protein, partial [Micromonosporaceae bacterium]